MLILQPVHEKNGPLSIKILGKHRWNFYNWI